MHLSLLAWRDRIVSIKNQGSLLFKRRGPVWLLSIDAASMEIPINQMREVLVITGLLPGAHLPPNTSRRRAANTERLIPCCQPLEDFPQPRLFSWNPAEALLSEDCP